MVVYEPAEHGVNDSSQYAIPAVPVAASAQSPEFPNAPDVGRAVQVTVPVGVLARLEAVSITIAVHVIARPVATDKGEHATPVDVASSAAIGPDWPMLAWWPGSPL